MRARSFARPLRVRRALATLAGLSDSAPRPLTGLELLHAVLVGLSAGIVAAPFLGAIDLSSGPSGLDPLAPAWLARGGSVAGIVALIRLASTRARAPDRGALRQAVGVRLSVLGAVAGATALLVIPALVASLDSWGLLFVFLAPLGSGFSGALSCAALGGAQGRMAAARKGLALAFATCLLTALVFCWTGLFMLALGGQSGRAGDSLLAAAIQSLALAIPLLILPAAVLTSFVRPGDAFDEPPLPL